MGNCLGQSECKYIYIYIIIKVIFVFTWHKTKKDISVNLSVPFLL